MLDVRHSHTNCAIDHSQLWSRNF